MSYLGDLFHNREAQLHALQKRLEHDVQFQRNRHRWAHLPHLRRGAGKPSFLQRVVRFLRGGGD